MCGSQAKSEPTLGNKTREHAGKHVRLNWELRKYRHKRTRETEQQLRINVREKNISGRRRRHWSDRTCSDFHSRPANEDHDARVPSRPRRIKEYVASIAKEPTTNKIESEYHTHTRTHTQTTATSSPRLSQFILTSCISLFLIVSCFRGIVLWFVCI